MGFFDTPKPNISKREFADARNVLYVHGFTERELHDVDKIFFADLEGVRDSDRGIDAKEFAGAMNWLRTHLGEHTLSMHKLDTLEEVLSKKL